MKTKLTCLIALLAPFLVCAQQTSPAIAALQQRLSSSFEMQFKNYPQEKVYAHVSQNVFLSGQTIWYQVYALAYGKPSDLSKIAYVRLSDDKGRLIKQDKLPLKNSTGWGNIDLPDTLKSGWYRLQAFTSWALNFNSADLFTQVLYIQNPREPLDPGKFSPPAANNFYVSFYPEGGKLVDGTTGNIAFKAEDSNGMPINVYGEVLDGQGKKVTTIHSVHDGMGSFNLETIANTAYTARVHFPDNSVQNLPLPVVENAGISMRTAPGTAAEINLLFSTVGQRQPVRDVLVEAVQENGVAIGYPLQLSRGINVFSFDKKNFQTGIVHFGLFDESGQLIGERAVFVKQGNSPEASLQANDLSIAAGSTNTLTFNVHDAAGRPVDGNFSISVTDAAMGNAVSDNLGSFASLSTETPGYLSDPGYYLKNNSDSLQTQLDQLMLTTQAHYPQWEKVMANKPVPLRYAVEQSQFIAGRVEKYNPAEKLKIKMMITSADSGKVMAYVAPDNTGLFKLGNYTPPGNADVLYEIVNAKNRKQAADVTFFNENLDTVSLGKGKLLNPVLANPGINTSFIESAAGALKEYYQAKGIMLKAVDIREQRKDALQKMIDSHVKRLVADNAFSFELVDESIAGSQKILDYLIGRVPGLARLPVWSYNGQSTLMLTQAAIANTKPYFYIDEMLADEDEVDNMSITDVALVRFLPPPVWFAPLGGGFIGVIMIYTKNHNDDVNSFKVGHAESRWLNHYTINGFSKPREFSATTNTGDKQKTSASFSATLFWAHDIQSDAEGNARVHFIANGKTKKYRVILQGMDKDGRPVYLEKILTAAEN